MENRVSTDVAAKELGMSRMAMCLRMERNLFNPPIGYCYPSIKGNKIQHIVYRDMLDKYLGKG